MRPTAYEFGDFRVDVARRSLLLKADDRPLPISARAFDTLLFFLEHPGELLDKSTLMAAIWPKVGAPEGERLIMPLRLARWASLAANRLGGGEDCRLDPAHLSGAILA